MGKAGLVGRKIAATLSSIGRPAFFLHPAEALHGDLGLVAPEDVVLALSNSGETEELIRLLPSLKRLDIAIVSLTGNLKSTIAQHSNVVVDVGVEREADPLDLAPTASTAAILAMGDALAVALLRKRGFGRDQFAVLHPGGSLGKELLWHVKDLMHVEDAVPIVQERATMRDAICEMTAKSLGAAFIVDREGRLTGVFTDGDLRRLLQRVENPLELAVADVMALKPKILREDAAASGPKTIRQDALAVEALRMMEDNAITILPVVDDRVRPFGAVHLHDLVRAGLSVRSNADRTNTSRDV
jgi:arabinose-5-phosphate isomerase